MKGHDSNDWPDGQITRVMDKPLHFKMVQSIVDTITEKSMDATSSSTSIFRDIASHQPDCLGGESVAESASCETDDPFEASFTKSHVLINNRQIISENAPIAVNGKFKDSTIQPINLSDNGTDKGIAVRSSLVVPAVGSGLDRVLRFLVADDSRSCRKIMRHSLGRRLGYEVEEVQDGAEAVLKVETSMAEGRPFDVVFLDMSMPIMDGMSAARKLTTSIGFKGRIIGFTGFAVDSFPHHRNAGMHAIESKPIEHSRLLAIIQGQLDVTFFVFASPSM